MEANELRIGNYFYDRSNKILRLDWWEHINKLASDMSVNGMKVHPMTEHIGNARPIPLTEEWLVKFGFTKDKKHTKCCDLKLENDFYLQGIGYGKSNFKYEVILTDSNDNELTLVKHVHQLQNLYFALTNKELTIK